MISNLQQYVQAKKLVDVLGVTPWRRIFENPNQLSGWITFQLGVAIGSRASEQAMLASHLAQFICRAVKHHGFLHVAKYLKTVKLLMYKSLACDPECSYTPGGKLVSVSLSRSGCPRIVLKRHRLLFKNAPDSDRALTVARMYVTGLDVYKLIVCDPGPVDLSGVVGKFPEGFQFVPGTRRPKSRPIRFLHLLSAGVPQYERMPLITGISDSFIWTAGPSPQPLGNSAYWRDQAFGWVIPVFRASYDIMARAFVCWPGSGVFHRAHRALRLESDGVPVSWRTPVPSHPGMQRKKFALKAIFQDLWDLPEATLDLQEFRSWIPEALYRGIPRGFRILPPDPPSPQDRARSVHVQCWTRYVCFGAEKGFIPEGKVFAEPMMRLASKIEPAGKVRVFTILDSLSQRLLEPIHDWFCDILRLIPQDGTFDQLRPLKSVTGTRLFSIDLRSATDRMPAQLTAGMMAHLFSVELASLWLEMMRREVSSGKLKYTGATPPLRFAQGTPLGALSAWPAFALTHHLLVQDAARRAGVSGWFSNYAIVGDDLVLGDAAVAAEYRITLDFCDVKVSREKSIESTNSSCEFCSRFRWRGTTRDASPISFKSVTAARAKAELLPSLLARLNEWYPRRISEALRIIGWGYRNLALLPSMFQKGPSVISRRKFNGWLLQFHPLRDAGWSWDLWLAAGRGLPFLPPEIIGLVHWHLLSRFMSTLESEGYTLTLPYECDEQDEEMLVRPLVGQYLRSLSPTLLALSQGELITPLVRHPPPKKDLKRTTSVPKGRSQQGTLLRLYDRAWKFMRCRPLLLGEV